MNAIILAAGMGTRLRPLTNEIPKCLVNVNGTPIIERQIQYLNDIDIKEITLISGYKASALDYLKDKYGVKIIFNDKYDISNNLYSMLLALAEFGDTYVLEGDVYMKSNCLLKDIEKSSYFATYKIYTNEWELEVDDNLRLTHIKIGNGKGYIMSGLSYWTKNDAQLIKQEIYNLADKCYLDLFWDNAVINLLDQLNVKIVRANDLYEIDTIEDLYQIQSAEDIVRLPIEGQLQIKECRIDSETVKHKGMSV